MPPTATPSTDLYARVQHAIPRAEWEAAYAADATAISKLKEQRGAIIVAHNYQTPQIFHGVADIVGDSLALARAAQECDAGVIVMAGVYFMAETAKLLNPASTVLVPDLAAGCSLADSITPADVLTLRAQHPGVPVVTYVNTSAAVKAVSDICCTSGNAVEVIESLGVDRVIMIPDEYLAQNIAARTGVEVITWPGHCEVHERFTPADIDSIRQANPGVVVLAHPECPPAVVAAADMAGSTAQMQQYIDTARPRRLALITECSMSDNLAATFTDVDFVRPCNLCPHMKRNTLGKIAHSLATMTHEVVLDPQVAAGARASLEAMLAINS